MNFCSDCGKPVRLVKLDDDHKLRYVCTACGKVHYQNPRLIVGCLPCWEDRVLLCLRSNEPKSGFWTLPAGFMENDETIEVGAVRETREEANADVEIVRLLSVYSVPVVSQVHLFFLANLKNQNFFPGHETVETRLFAQNEIPWDAIAFSSVRFTVENYFASRDSRDVFIGSYNRTA
jgi:ADP-ribose pyrophosphatase YjhB (NUDIX family)